MNSETSTRYGSRVRRHGRSRAARAYQASSLRRNDLTPWPPLHFVERGNEMPDRRSPSPPLHFVERGNEMPDRRSPSPPLHFVERGNEVLDRRPPSPLRGEGEMG